MTSEGEQAELFQADTTWFHVFKDMIDSGDMARLDGSAIKTYLVVKSYTNFSTGRSFPPLEAIAQKTGLSERQVMRALQELERFEYITKSKVGRHNVYTLREKVTITSDVGEALVATWDYIPNSVREAVADIKHVIITGNLAGAKIVTIQNLTVNVLTGTHARQVNLNKIDLAKLPKDAREALLAVTKGDDFEE